jgi:uncharacterized membrane protein
MYYSCHCSSHEVIQGLAKFQEISSIRYNVRIKVLIIMRSMQYLLRHYHYIIAHTSTAPIITTCPTPRVAATIEDPEAWVELGEPVELVGLAELVLLMRLEF